MSADFHGPMSRFLRARRTLSQSFLVDVRRQTGVVAELAYGNTVAVRFLLDEHRVVGCKVTTAVGTLGHTSISPFVGECVSLVADRDECRKSYD